MQVREVGVRHACGHDGYIRVLLARSHSLFLKRNAFRYRGNTSWNQSHKIKVEEKKCPAKVKVKEGEKKNSWWKADT